MEFLNGIEFIESKPEDVIDHLKNVKREVITVPPDQLYIYFENEKPYLSVNSRGQLNFQVRKAFLHKLLRWCKFPVSQLLKLSPETLCSLLNDCLLLIKSPVVNIKLEDGEALTITGNRYSEITDLFILEHLNGLNVEKITRTDFFMRIYSEISQKIEILEGDEFGFGINIVNSETGFKALSVHNYILRYICNNGAVAKIGQVEKLYHYAHHRDFLEFSITRGIKQFHANKERIIDSIQNSVNSKLDDNFDVIKKQLTSLMGSKQSKTIMEELDPNSNLFTLFNHLTNRAKEFDSDKRLQIEELAGNMVTNKLT